MNFIKPFKIYFFVFIVCFFVSSMAHAEDIGGSIELNGDSVEYALEGSKIIARGNVVVIHQDTKLLCDYLEFSRDSKVGKAEGHVRLKMKTGEISGDRMVYNFETGEGEFQGAKIQSNPYYGKGTKVSKVSLNQINLEQGYLTTCDLDKPHFHLGSKKIEVYPGDKMVARNVRLVIGKLPILYIPRLSQSLKDKKPQLLITPGYTKDWGSFALAKWRQDLGDKVKLTLHLDARERKDIAEGFDLKYDTDSFGSGVIKTYYMNERTLGVKHFFDERTVPTTERERFKAEWRHKWDIDDKTQAVWQYYKLSDPSFLHDYFKKENEKDNQPRSFFVLTKNLNAGVLGFNVEDRVNRWEQIVERLPEVTYDLANQPLGESGFYWQSKSTYSNLSLKDPVPTEVHKETMRFDTYNDISYPMKVSILEITPFVGGRETYYSKTKDISRYDIVRGIFNTGATLSTKFYKVLNYDGNLFNQQVKSMRHVLTPRLTYEFTPEPTVPASLLDIYDSSIDNLDNSHTMNLAIENKLQVKKEDGTKYDMARLVVGTDFRLKEHPTGGGFDLIKSELDFLPVDWLSLYFDSEYDTRKDHLSTANFDIYLNDDDDRWSVGVGKRFNREVDDQLTSEFKYRINPKWAFRMYQRFDVLNGLGKEQEFTISRDLHEWQADLSFNETRGQGSEIWLVFTLKAFPESAIDFGTSFNRRKTGSQSSE